ncbi:MAG: hypothetical protein J2P36_01720, partial [Ktedonobacteraceae bacterium]|nr:hypothetical protein [Ktedonobacteraceae bacterium]
LLRTDADIQTQIAMMAAIFSGFFVVNQILSPDYQFSPEEMVKRLAETLHRTFEPEGPPDPEALEEVARTFDQLLDQFAAILERKYNEATL